MAVGFVVQASAEPVFGDDGEIVGGINCLQEITERRQIESGLARERQILNAIMEATPDCIKIVARDGTLLQMNPAGLRMIEATNRRSGSRRFRIRCYSPGR